MKKILTGIFGFWIIWSMQANAQTRTVASISELQSAIKKLNPGDTVFVKDGVYSTTEDLMINAVGTKEKPIVISALHIGKAEINGKGGFNLAGTSSHIIICGFVFKHQSSKAKSGSGTSFCQWSYNVFETADKGESLTIAGSDHEIDFNTFRNKNSMGRYLAIRGSGNQIAERLWIHHNYFVDFADQGGPNGAEAFQFGLSGFSLSTSNSIVEFNLFERCAGENELISVKASGVTLRYNTIRDCKAQFTLRHGNRCLVYGNYFFNTPGLRIFGDDHLIHSNYFEGCDPAITIGNGGAEVADGAPLTSHDRPDRDTIVFNTMVNNSKNIIQQGRDKGLGATYILLANNIIQGGGPAVKIAGPYLNPVWGANIIFQTAGEGDMPTGSFKSIDPKFSKDQSGIFHLQKNSPAIDAAATKFPGITTDMDGQPRTNVPDIGADEFSDKGRQARALNPGDVGAAFPIARGHSYIHLYKNPSVPSDKKDQ